MPFIPPPPQWDLIPPKKREAARRACRAELERCIRRNGDMAYFGCVLLIASIALVALGLLFVFGT